MKCISWKALWMSLKDTSWDWKMRSPLWGHDIFRVCPALSHLLKVILTYDGDKGRGLGNSFDKALDVPGVRSSVSQIRWTPDEYSKRRPEDLATLLKNSESVRLNSWYWNPSILRTAGANEFVKASTVMIAQTRSITAQTPIFISWPIYCHLYLQIEQIVNNSRLHQRQECHVDDLKHRIFSGALRIVGWRAWSRQKNHLLSRMKDFPMVLNDYRLQPDFAFDTPELQILYQLLCQNGEVTSFERP